MPPAHVTEEVARAETIRLASQLVDLIPPCYIQPGDVSGSVFHRGDSTSLRRAGDD